MRAVALLVVLLAAATLARPYTMLQFTDAHLDELYVTHSDASNNCVTYDPSASDVAGPLGNRNCDSPAALIQGVVAWATTLQPDYILWTGDNSRHEWGPPNRTTAEIWRDNLSIAKLLLKAFPGVPIIPSIGNNDASTHDQGPVLPSDLQNLAQSWNGVFANSGEQAVFAQGGYFSRRVNSQLVLVSLNTIDLTWGSDDCAVPGSASSRQIAWLGNVLSAAAAEGGSIIITGHVPPSMWKSACRIPYASLSIQYNVSNHIYAHQHSDQLHFVSLTGKVDRPFPSEHCSEHIAVNCAPSLLPQFNPSLRVYELDSNFLISDYVQYYASLEMLNSLVPVPKVIPLQVEYRFSTAYKISGSLSSINTWCQLHDLLLSKPSMQALYDTFKYVSSNATVYTRVCRRAVAQGKPWRC